jgi:hypothetical protein
MSMLPRHALSGLGDVLISSGKVSRVVDRHGRVSCYRRERNRSLSHQRLGQSRCR